MVGPCTGNLLPFGPTNFDCTDLPSVGASININANSVLDTTAGTLTIGGAGQTIASVMLAQAGAPELFIVFTDQLTVGSGFTLQITGNRAAVLVASGNVTIDGTIMAGAAAGQSGPGADNATACGSGLGTDGTAQVASNAATAGSGGSGGGFGSAGGLGINVSTAPDLPAAGGVVNGNTQLSPLRGGCRGGDGGLGTGGPAGGSGGAVQIVAGGVLTVAGSGVVTSPGGGGSSVTGQFSGGGGGGSGGAVFLEANSVTVTGAVTANGGGGSEGTRGGTGAGVGVDGHIADALPAAGGGGMSQGGDGGDGAAGAVAAADGQQGNNDATRAAASGGGGGGVGRVRFRSVGSAANVTGVVSPPAQ
jgi:hypothetical protein